MSKADDIQYKKIALQIRCMFHEELGVIYKGDLKVVRPIDPWTGEKLGWRVLLYLNNLDKPMSIDYAGEELDIFLNLVREQIHEDAICNHVRFYSSSLIETNKAITDIRKDEHVEQG